MKKIALAMCLLIWSAAATAADYKAGEYIVQMDDTVSVRSVGTTFPEGTTVKPLFNNWYHVVIPVEYREQMHTGSILSASGVNYAIPNRTFSLFGKEADFNPAQECPPGVPQELCDILFPPGDGGGGGGGGGNQPGDNPDFPAEVINETTGADPEYSKQWGMEDIGLKAGLAQTQGSPEVVVAVVDTGVDYTHEDLKASMWRNPGETGTDENGADKASNGIDDDGNGFIDDVVGWDAIKNDNKPYDLTSRQQPGHGSHCAGNIAARYNNSIGITGVAPNVKIMAVRIFSEAGQTDEASILTAMKYAIDNGATLASNSWGGTMTKEQAANDQAFKDILNYSKERGVLQIFAAGNGDQLGRGFDNDGAKGGYPASFDNEIVLSVAALSKNGSLTGFSNWGKISVDVGAPGAGIYSTIPGNKYMNMSGTSMATPITAGAAALYKSKNLDADWMQVKQAIIDSTRPVPALSNKVLSGGKLNVEDLMKL